MRQLLNWMSRQSQDLRSSLCDHSGCMTQALPSARLGCMRRLQERCAHQISAALPRWEYHFTRCMSYEKPMSPPTLISVTSSVAVCTAYDQSYCGNFLSNSYLWPLHSRGSNQLRGLSILTALPHSADPLCVVEGQYCQKLS